MMPFSQQFDDVYHTSSGALEQAQQVFLKGCHLPYAWKNAEHFTILETGFGLGLNFLATWLAWRQDPQHCKRLHFVSVEAYPVKPHDILKSVQNIPALQGLAQKLAQHYPLRIPGIYRIVFDEEQAGTQPGQVILTLAIGEASKQLPQLCLQADAIYLDGFSPAKNPQLWEKKILQNIARLAAPKAKIASWCVAGQVRRGLEECGFDICKVQGLAPKREALSGTFNPKAFSRRTKTSQTFEPAKATDAIIIGAGFAGAAMCWALSQRGWQVTLIDQHNGPAQEASGLPIGLALPYISTDDALASQITRSGVQWLRHIIDHCKLAPQYWGDSTVEQLVANQNDTQPPSSLGIYGAELFEPGQTNEGQHCRLFQHGLRVEGLALVKALLRHSPGVQYHWNTKVTKITRTKNGLWQVADAQNRICAQSPHIVVAAAMQSLPLCGIPNKGIIPNRGQMALGLPMFAVSGNMLKARTGHGHFLLRLRPDAGWSWSMGSTFSPGDIDTEIQQQDYQKLLEKLCRLSPQTAQALQPQFEQQQLSAFVQIRSTTTDHLPLAGSVPDIEKLALLNPHHLNSNQCPVLPGLHILSSLGSRGLATGAWCAELLASAMHGEPLPFTLQQANAVMPARFELRHLRQQQPCKKAKLSAKQALR